VRALVLHGTDLSLEERPDPTPGANEVLVAAPYAAVNPADLAQRAGHYPAPPGAPADIPGLEVTGRVVAVGERALDWNVGDHVFGLVGGGGLADRVVVHERHVVAVPERLDDEEATAVPEAFLTAHDAVVTQGGLRPGELLLVNGANGGVGTSAVQIAKLIGARVVASAREEEARRRLAELGADAVAPDEAAERAVAKGGANVVLELVGAPNMARNVEALATWGRIVVIGTSAGSEAELSLRMLMHRRGRILASTLRARPLEEKAAAVQAFGRQVVPALAEGHVHGIVDHVFPVEDFEQAFEHVARPGKFGKVLLRF
jgi:putative PIG3 family NAD(P)H quinone oxidoreductase